MASLIENINRIYTNKENIKKAIITKGVTVPDGTTLDQYAELITKINSGVDSGDATATAADIRYGKTAYIDNVKVTGTMPNRGTTNHSLPINGSFTIPAGYHNGSGKITQNIPFKTAATYTPSTANQSIAAGQYLSGQQTIKGDANLIPSNIVKGRKIFGVTGSAAASSEIDSDKIAWGEYIVGKQGTGFSEINNYYYAPFYQELSWGQGVGTSVPLIHGYGINGTYETASIQLNSAKTYLCIRYNNTEYNLAAIKPATQSFYADVTRITDNSYLVFYYLVTTSTGLHGTKYVRKVSITPDGVSLKIGDAVTLCAAESTSAHYAVTIMRSLFSKYASLVLIKKHTVSSGLTSYSYFTLFIDSATNKLAVKKTTDANGNSINVSLGSTSDYYFYGNGVAWSSSGITLNSLAAILRVKKSNNAYHFYTLQGLTKELAKNTNALPVKGYALLPDTSFDNGFFCGNTVFDNTGKMIYGNTANSGKVYMMYDQINNCFYNVGSGFKTTK